jgi:hypothetical protein
MPGRVITLLDCWRGLVKKLFSFRCVEDVPFVVNVV